MQRCGVTGAIEEIDGLSLAHRAAVALLELVRNLAQFCNDGAAELFRRHAASLVESLVYPLLESLVSQVNFCIFFLNF